MEAYVIIRELQDSYFKESLELMNQEKDLEEVDQILPQERRGQKKKKPKRKKRTTKKPKRKKRIILKLQRKKRK